MATMCSLRAPQFMRTSRLPFGLSLRLLDGPAAAAGAFHPAFTPSTPLRLSRRPANGSVCCRASASRLDGEARQPSVFVPQGLMTTGRQPLATTHARRGFLSELESIRDEDNGAGPISFDSPLGIVLYPDPRLRSPNKRINVFDESLQRLIKEMFDVMYNTDGVGLSAPQVGVNVRLMVFNPTGERGKGMEMVLANPKVTKYRRERGVVEEGCLSFPNIYADVERPLSVKVDAQDASGRKFSISLKDWQARIFQHEYDHLQGTLYFDRMTPEVLATITDQLVALEDKYAEVTGKPLPESVLKKSGAAVAS